MIDRATYDVWFARLEADPEDDAARVVFGDLAREWGDDELAEWLALELLHRRGLLAPGDRERFTHLAATLPTDVRARISGAELDHCAAVERSTVPLAFACPMRWERMRPTEDARVRVCGACAERVHWVESVEEADARASEGRCVALAPGLRRPAPASTQPLFEPPPVALAGKPARVPDLSFSSGSGGGDPERRPWWRRLFGG